MAFEPIPDQPGWVLVKETRPPQANLTGSSSGAGLQFNASLFKLMGKPRYVGVDIDPAHHAIRIGDHRRAHYFVFQVEQRNRMIGGQRMATAGMDLGHYTLRDHPADGSFILVHKNHPTPEKYDWQRITKVTNWMTSPAGVTIYAAKRNSAALTRKLHEAMNFTMAIVIEADVPNQRLRVRPATINDPAPLNVHYGGTPSFAPSRLLHAGMKHGKYQLTEKTEDGWYILDLAEEVTGRIAHPGNRVFKKKGE